MTILDILFFNFSNSTKSMSSEALNPLKTISDDSIWHPKGHPSIPRKSQNLQFFRFWPCLVLMDSICMLWRHVYALETCVCCGDMGYALWTWDMSSCGRRICLVVGEEHMSSCWTRIDVFLWEKNMSSCWRRIYGYGRCLLVGEEYMGMLLKTFQGALRLAAGALF